MCWFRFRALRDHECVAADTRWALLKFYPFWPFVGITWKCGIKHRRHYR